MITFNEIYTAAKTNDLAKLVQWVIAKVFFEVIQEGHRYYETPAYWLAFEGEHAAVELLRISGAKTDYIAFAYAQAGNHEKADEYRVKHNVNADSIAAGYALAGEHAKVEEYRKQHYASVDAIIRCYALAGDDAKVEEYHIKHGASVDWAVRGYALASRHAKVEEYREKYMASVDWIARSYALAGLDFKVKEYHEKYNVKVDYITWGYAQAGNHSMLEDYRVKYRADANVIVWSYAQAGNHPKVEEYVFKYNVDLRWIANGYFRGGYHTKSKRYFTLAIQSERARLLAVRQFIGLFPLATTGNLPFANIFSNTASHNVAANGVQQTQAVVSQESVPETSTPTQDKPVVIVEETATVVARVHSASTPHHAFRSNQSVVSEQRPQQILSNLLWMFVNNPIAADQRQSALTLADVPPSAAVKSSTSDNLVSVGLHQRRFFTDLKPTVSIKRERDQDAPVSTESNEQHAQMQHAKASRVGMNNG